MYAYIVYLVTFILSVSYNLLHANMHNSQIAVCNLLVILNFNYSAAGAEG
jgi:hypothetical protein